MELSDTVNILNEIKRHCEQTRGYL